MNVLAFKLNETNKAQFKTERAKINLILKEKRVPTIDEVWFWFGRGFSELCRFG
jgi:hypothetical protein